MGYSCTSAAASTLDNIVAMYAKGPSHNVLTFPTGQYFFERGPEKRDGAIEGGVFKIISTSSYRPAGTFRINPDGTIHSFFNMPHEHDAELEKPFTGSRPLRPVL